MSDNENKSEEVKNKPIIIRSTIDLQRLKLEKLMKNPDKPILIPEKPKERGVPSVPDFVRNVMGSSAGAGSGEFHVYRHLRRKEYARQRYMKAIGEKEKLDNEYREKLETYKQLADEKTAKKRAKRLQKKKKRKSKAKKAKLDEEHQSSENSESSENEDQELITESKQEELPENKVVAVENDKNADSILQNTPEENAEDDN